MLTSEKSSTFVIAGFTVALAVVAILQRSDLTEAQKTADRAAKSAKDAADANARTADVLQKVSESANKAVESSNTANIQSREFFQEQRRAVLYVEGVNIEPDVSHTHLVATISIKNSGSSVAKILWNACSADCLLNGQKPKLFQTPSEVSLNLPNRILNSELGSPNILTSKSPENVAPGGGFQKMVSVEMDQQSWNLWTLHQATGWVWGILEYGDKFGKHYSRYSYMRIIDPKTGLPELVLAEQGNDLD